MMRGLIAFTLGFALASSFMAIKKAYSSSLVSIFEVRFGAPGTSHVFPECNCTLQYVGTNVRGRDYFVHLRALD